MTIPRSVPTIPQGGNPPGTAAAPSGRRGAFNVQLDETDYARLDALASVTARSRGAVVRQALQFMHQMLVQGIPTCASGQFCPVPHVHRPNPLGIGQEVPR